MCGDDSVNVVEKVMEMVVVMVIKFSRGCGCYVCCRWCADGGRWPCRGGDEN